MPEKHLKHEEQQIGAETDWDRYLAAMSWLPPEPRWTSAEEGRRRRVYVCLVCQDVGKLAVVLHEGRLWVWSQQPKDCTEARFILPCAKCRPATISWRYRGFPGRRKQDWVLSGDAARPLSEWALIRDCLRRYEEWLGQEMTAEDRREATEKIRRLPAELPKKMPPSAMADEIPEEEEAPWWTD